MLGFVCGWAARSTVDSPHAFGVRLFAIAQEAKTRLGRWLAVEQERITDMLAEARAQDTSYSARDGADSQGGSALRTAMNPDEQ